MLKTILSVSGKPGLYKMISQGKNILIIESLIDKKRIPSYTRDKVMALGNITVFTNDEDVPLYKVLNSIKEKENIQKVSIDMATATPDALRSYFAEVLPEFDRERVYLSDIKRILNWYNILLDAGITQFDPEETTEEDTDKKEAETENAPTKPKEETKPQKTVSQKKTTNPKITPTPIKKQPVIGKVQQRIKAK